jgi:hypothetical protein
MTARTHLSSRTGFTFLAACGGLAGCAAMFAGDGIGDHDKSWHGAVKTAVTIANPRGAHPGGGEHVAASLVDWQINQNFADVSIASIDEQQACFNVSAWQTQAENTKAYDLMVATRDEKRTVSQFPPTAVGGVVAVRRRWTKPVYNDFHVEVNQLPYVDYSVCFPSGAVAIGPDTGTIILRGTNTWEGHAFAIFNISRMGG